MTTGESVGLLQEPTCRQEMTVGEGVELSVDNGADFTAR